MIEEISEVNSRKGGNPTPEGVKNPVWPAPEADERAASRALKHE